MKRSADAPVSTRQENSESQQKSRGRAAESLHPQGDLSGAPWRTIMESENNARRDGCSARLESEPAELMSIRAEARRRGIATV
ncbi:hypothetical protein [Salicola sp. Rm-C-2C1-2]|uniref:hypothetical protein n=1 Tax=Salicola sp. Rm-C-2C1-2 TaxID=3141321 RepID=UPI0032E41FE1